MAASNEFTPWDFLKLVKELNEQVKELNEHEADLKIKLARAGVASTNPAATGAAA